MPLRRTPTFLIVTLPAAGTSLIQPSLRSGISALTGAAVVEAPPTI